MTEFALVLAVDPDKEEVTITGAQGKNRLLDPKTYDRVRTAGEIGTAVKDFVMGMGKE